VRLFGAEVGRSTVADVFEASAKVMCDADALAELLEGVTHACCDDPDFPIDCSGGVPSRCGVDCAEAFLPMWKSCGSMFRSNPDLAPFAPFADECAQAQSRGAASSCGYTELLPIVMDCTMASEQGAAFFDDGTAPFDFCASACYSHLRQYAEACEEIMPEAAATLKKFEAQMDACGAGAGDASTDLGEECDVYSIRNACLRLDMGTITAALSAGAACDHNPYLSLHGICYGTRCGF
jgi:hypothetical protein